MSAFHLAHRVAVLETRVVLEGVALRSGYDAVADDGGQWQRFRRINLANPALHAGEEVIHQAAGEYVLLVNGNVCRAHRNALVVVHAQGRRNHAKERTVDVGVVHVDANECGIVGTEYLIEADGSGIFTNIKNLSGRVVVRELIGTSRGADGKHIQNRSELRRSGLDFAALERARNRARAGDADALARSFVVEEEEGLFLED